MDDYLTRESEKHLDSLASLKQYWTPFEDAVISASMKGDYIRFCMKRP